MALSLGTWASGTYSLEGREFSSLHFEGKHKGVFDCLLDIQAKDNGRVAFTASVPFLGLERTWSASVKEISIYDDHNGTLFSVIDHPVSAANPHLYINFDQEEFHKGIIVVKSLKALSKTQNPITGFGSKSLMKCEF